MANRRSREDILVSILKTCVSDKLTITRLMATLGLQHGKLTDYLEHLASANLIEYSKYDGRVVICTTDLGEEAARSYRNAVALLNGYSTTRPKDEPDHGTRILKNNSIGT